MRKIKFLIALGAAVMLVSIVVASFAQSAGAKATTTKDENWVLLGSHVVDYTLDHDVVNLEGGTDLYTGLKFKIVNGPINLHKCTVHFGNGETQDVSFSTNVTAPASSSDGRQVDLYGNSRKIDKITFWYDTKNSSDKKAVVEVWGKGKRDI